LVAHDDISSEWLSGWKPAQAAGGKVDVEADQEAPDKASSGEATVDTESASNDLATALPIIAGEGLAELEAIAVAQNPALTRISREYEAAAAKSDYVDALPDPTIAGSVFITPIETAAGSQRANLTLSQKIPSLARLDAQARQACLDAMAIQQVYASERLKIVGDVRARWYQLYVIAKQIEINTENQDLLEALIEVANARVETGDATQGDVLVATVQYSKLEERLVSLRQQRVSVTAEINRLLGRNSETPIGTADELPSVLPEWDHAMLRQVAWEHQPDLIAAHIRTQATLWGLEVARLKRRPDFSLSASWFGIEGNRPTPNIVDVGRDAWAIGGSVSIPISRRKYDAIEREANWKHQASHASVEELRQRYDSLLRDLWEQARAADETAKLYQDTILPQARDTLEADQESYANGNVEFDRVIRDFRSVVTLELGYHRAVGQLATAVARIRQATGIELEPVAATQE
jgi:outer membrane protein TolC